MSSTVTIPLSPITISSSRAVDKCIEEAQNTGELILNGRQLKEFPKNSFKYDLSCTLLIDLSKNKLHEFPQQLESLGSVEVLNLSHNILKCIPSSIIKMSNIVCLNLSRNLLTNLPPSLSDLFHLEILLISNNKLVSIPEEICQLRKLMQLDVSCNNLSHLPPQLGHTKSLESLSLRQNLLVELPASIGQLNLKYLDFSSNRIARIPVEFGRMKSLEVLHLEKNPLVSPPANVCGRGVVHILKMLNKEAAKDEKRKCHLNLHGSSPRFGCGKFAGSASCLSFDSSPSPSLTSSSSSSFSSKQAHLSVHPDSLPPQPSRGNRLMTRSFKSPGENMPTHHTNGDHHKHQRSSSYGVTDKSPFVNGFSNHDSSTLGRRKLDIDPVAIGNGADGSIADDGCRSEVDETRKTAMKLMDGTRMRRLSQGVNREEVQQATYRMNSYDNSHSNQFVLNNNNNNTIPSTYPKNVLPVACRRALESMTQQLNDLDPGFTFKRTCRAAREEEDLILRMMQVIESSLNVRLPSNLRAYLKDGIVLCRLVNHCFPHTITVIHAPNHPKADLSVAKCRLNVDSFLQSCHMIGLPKSQICSAPSILDERNLADVARTVLSLVGMARGQTSL